MKPPPALEGGGFYDDARVFETYLAHRARPTSPNELIEEPAFLEELGPVSGLRVLDLGCGDARFGRQLLAQGCSAYVGIDASRNMARQAEQTLAGTLGRVRHARIEDFTGAPASFDVVVSRLALHYIEELERVLRQVRGVLASAGRLVFSVEHPVITSCDRGWDQRAPRTSWLVDDYFVTGRRETDWIGARVVKFHRTVADYVGLVQASGFRLERLREPAPDAERFASLAELQRRRRIPLFLLLSAAVVDG